MGTSLVFRTSYVGRATEQKHNFVVPSLFFCSEESIAKFQTLAEADNADREFYHKLSGEERPKILLQLTHHEPKCRLERVYRVTKLPQR
jgi:hypothetical protein